MTATIYAYALSACLGFASFAFAQDSPRLKPIGEQLIARFPTPDPTEAELSEPCVDHSETSVQTERAYLSLTSRRAYLFAIDLWGVKWFPKHAANPRYRWMGLCNDEVFVLKQFKKAIGQPMTAQWTETDVRRLADLVEQEAIKLVESGELGPWLLEPSSKSMLRGTSGT
jgi:hypothetical protein